MEEETACPRCGVIVENIDVHIGTNPCVARETVRDLEALGMIRLSLMDMTDRVDALAPFGGKSVLDTWYPGSKGKKGIWTSHLWLPLDRLAEAAAALPWPSLRKQAETVSAKLDT